MDEATHKAWWPLHLRAAKGELLTEAEQLVYETGTQQLDAEEHLEFDMARLQRTREQIRQTEAERLELEARRQRLQARIAQIEAAMSARGQADTWHWNLSAAHPKLKILFQQFLGSYIYFRDS